MKNVSDIFEQVQKFVQKCVLFADRDFQISIDCMCRVIAHGHHGNNAMHSSTFSSLKDTIGNKVLLENKSTETWSEFLSVFRKSCDELQQYCIGRDRDVLKELSSIAFDAEEIVRNRESLESKLISLGNNKLHSAGLFAMMQNSRSPFEFGNIIFSIKQRRLTN